MGYTENVELLAIYLPVLFFCFSMFALFFATLLQLPKRHRFRNALFFFLVAAAFLAGGLYMGKLSIELVRHHVDFEELLRQLLTFVL